MSLLEAQTFIRTTGLAKASQYALFFTGPFDIIPVTASKRLTINCEECFFPSKSIFTSDVRHYGNMYKIPYSHEFTNEVTMIFRIGSDMYEKRVFEEWMNKIISPDNFNHEYYDEFTSRIMISQINPNPTASVVDDRNLLEKTVDNFKNSVGDQLGFDLRPPKPNISEPIGSEEKVYTCVLEEAYPIGIMELPIAHSNANTYHRIGVTFTFKNWKSLPELTNQDIREQSLKNTRELNSDLNRQRSGSNGSVIDVLAKGVEQYGPSFRASGGSLFSF